MSLFSKILPRAVLASLLFSAVTACSSVEQVRKQDPGPTYKRTIRVADLGNTGSYAANGLRKDQALGLPSLGTQLAWRADSLRANPSFDPGRRPSHVPSGFDHEPWKGELPLISPKAKAIFTSDFGWRGLSNRRDFHSGIDIAADAGTRVYTPVSGQIIYVKHAGTDSGIIITDGERQHTFWHTKPKAAMKEGDWITAGHSVGTLVPWGSRTHLHYSVHLTGATLDHAARNDGNAIDPLTLAKRLRQTPIPIDGIQLGRVVRDAQHRSYLIDAARTPIARSSKPRITLPQSYSKVIVNIPSRSLGYNTASNGYNVRALMAHDSHAGHNH